MIITFSDGKKEDLKAVWLDEDPHLVHFVDQRKIPGSINILTSKTVEETSQFIKDMVIRGAPSIGIAGAYGMVQSVVEAYEQKYSNNKQQFLKKIKNDAKILISSRPTAVDLSNYVNEILLFCQSYKKEIPDISEVKLVAENFAKRLIEECNKIARTGASLIKNGTRILTHCHTGAFATVDIGTALGVIKEAGKSKSIHVYVDETRPRLQGGRITTWELFQAGINYTLITDSMAAHLMKENKIDLVLVGADRITSDGCVANKIGTYNLAVLCNYHKIPFYVAAPWSTFHIDLKGCNAIPIEERSISEVLNARSLDGTTEIKLNFPKSPVINPAFDVTPPELITGIIVPGTIIKAPYEQQIRKIVAPRLQKKEDLKN